MANHARLYKCQNCGASNQINEHRDTQYCSYCGTLLNIERKVNVFVQHQQIRKSKKQLELEQARRKREEKLEYERLHPFATKFSKFVEGVFMVIALAFVAYIFLFGEK